MSRFAFTLGLALFFLVVGTDCSRAHDAKALTEVDGPTAFSTAYADFQRHIGETTKGGTELDRFLSEIRNYKVTIYVENGNYVISFTPLRLNGVILRGGGAHYEIDGKNAKVVKFAPSR